MKLREVDNGAPKKREVKLHSIIKAIPLAKMRVSANAQRELRPARVDELLSDFDPELMDLPVMSFRDSWYYIVDGQHRIEALKRWLGEGWEKQSVDSRVYTGLNEKQEADLFIKLNNKLTVTTYSTFRVGVTAGYPAEKAIAEVCEKHGVKIALGVHPADESVTGAVGTLMRVYKRSNADVLGRTLHLITESFGAPGLRAGVIDGIAQMCQRYDGVLVDAEVIERLSSMRGGVGALLARAQVLRKQTGRQLGQCVAAATVDTINAGKGPRSGARLPSWWKVDEAVAA